MKENNLKKTGNYEKQKRQQKTPESRRYSDKIKVTQQGKRKELSIQHQI